ncbi:MAG: ABC transporter substrate-binding protein [Oscillospiraceae bacterium]|jgi:ABC-type transport system substrate-binding protein|nr:ABC transporter substrate-binding protein [Oscillospiraceae bacterium]
MKTNTRKIFALALCLTMIFTVASCGEKGGGESSSTSSDAGESGAPVDTGGAPVDAGSLNTAGAASARDTMTVAVSNDVGSLDPIDLGGGSQFKDISRMYCEPLFDIDANGDKVWILATGYETVTPTQWIVHLREGVKFSNGNPFTADDVYFTLKANNTHPTWSPSIPVLGDLSASRVIDDYTLELNFESYDLSVVNNFPTIQMYDAESYDDEDMKVHPIGTGPYLVSEYVIDSHVNLVPNPDYWGTPGKIPNLKFRVINEPAQIVNALTTGGVDIATVPAQDVSYVQTLPDYTVILRSSGSTQAIWFNTSVDSVFSSRDARLAAVYSLNRQSIVDLVYFGISSIPDWPLPSTTFEYTPELAAADPTYQNSPDIELAKQLAESSGLAAKPVVIATNGVAEVITMAEIVQANLREIGVTAEIINLDPATAFSVYQDTTQYDIFFSGLYVPSNTAAQHYYGWYTYMASLNKGVWEGKDRFAELAGLIMSVTDDAERYTYIKEMTEIFAREAPWYNLVEIMFAIGHNKNLVPGEFMMANNTYYSEWYWAA